jgi:hypothetical protein
MLLMALSVILLTVLLNVLCDRDWVDVRSSGSSIGSAAGSPQPVDFVEVSLEFGVTVVPHKGGSWL